MSHTEIPVDIFVTGDTTIGEYLEWSANRFGDGDEYYFIPFVFKKESGNMFKELRLDKLPDHVKDAIVNDCSCQSEK